MTMESALEAPRPSLARGPSGLRRLSLAMLGTEKVAEGFTGKPEGQGAQKPGQVLAAFKSAAPHLGFGPRVVHAIDWLFTFTQPQDWTEGSHPIVWPSASLERDALCLGETQVKYLNRQLVELGLVVMKDSPNGKRYGKRDGKGHIVEAYGFDLAPLGARQAEFEAVAQKGPCRARPHAPAAPAGDDCPQRPRPDRRDSGRARPHGCRLASPGGGGQGARPVALEGRTARRDGDRRRLAGAQAARGPGTAGKPASEGQGTCRRSCGFRPQGAGKPTPPIYLQNTLLS